MKCLLVYGTLSGSTMSASEVAAATLRTANHTVDMFSADEVTREKVAEYDVLIVSSPSWEDQGKDGQPLPEVRAFVESLTNEDLSGKKVALIGLGDTSYPHYCGAIDVMEEIFNKLSVTLVVPSLKIDRYYSLAANEQAVKDWATLLAGKLT
ncbi:MAG: flavodoxin domain-containing protein [Patescibacteria group bacterium]